MEKNINTLVFDLKVKLNNNKERVICLGKFTSLHKGHQLLLSKAADFAKKNNKELIIMLYPDYDGFSKKKLKHFLPLEIRKKLVKQYDANHLLIFEPNQKNYSIDKNLFMDFLCDNLNITDVFVGENFNFGANNHEAFEIIKRRAKIHVIKLMIYNGQIVSSTLLGLLLNEGSLSEIKTLTGFNFFFEGVVIHGTHMGTKYNTPTANAFVLSGTMSPKHGIYFSRTSISDVVYDSITSISNNPTFDNRDISFETHIFDFNKDIYGDNIRVELLKFLREPIKFFNEKELFEKINEDKEKAKKYFNDI